MRIALLSPYSWTYPGGVTRHIDALAGELRSAGHEARILAPYDPDDVLSRRLHRGARPQQADTGEDFVALGRTVGIPANGAVSNLSVTPQSVFRMRDELRGGGYDVVHVHEPVAPVLSWDALCSLGDLPLVGTFHTFSENLLTNGGAAIGLGGRRRMNRLHVRIAVSEAAAWTARRFYGGRYEVIPNGVRLLSQPTPARERRAEEPLRVVFVGQAVERKGLPVLLRAFEALREQIPATLTLVGAGEAEVAHMMLDGRGVHALGKVSEQRKLDELEHAHVLCAPSLGGESFGMVLTEAFAAGTPVLASDIPGYRDVLRDGRDGELVPAGDPLALAQALRGLALDEPRRVDMAASARERAERFAWPAVAAEVLECYERARRVGVPSTRVPALAVRYGLAPADRQPRIPAERIQSLQKPARPHPSAHRTAHHTFRRLALLAGTFAAGALATIALQRVGVTRVAGSLLASKPGLVAAALGVMCMAMFIRAIAWHAILAVAPTWRRATYRDAMQGTFIGVLMSATRPARLGEPSRALIVARRIGRARETLPVVLGTMVSQTLLNLLALALLAAAMLASADFGELRGHGGVILASAAAPLGAVLLAAVARLLMLSGGQERSARMAALRGGARGWWARLADGVRLVRRPRAALLSGSLQLGAWGLQLLSCWLLLGAFGVQSSTGFGAAAAVLFVVNVTAVLPVTPANVGVFQAACVMVLAGAYHVSTPGAIAFAIVLQLIELLTALVMGLPALVNEGLSWREVRLRTSHAAPVQLGPLPGSGEREVTRAGLQPS